MRASPPLRFLAIVLGGWAALRAAVIAPLWWTPPAGAAAAVAQSRALPLARPGSKGSPAPGPMTPPARERAAYAAAAPLAGAPPGPRPRSTSDGSVPVSAARDLPPGIQLAKAEFAPVLPPVALPPGAAAAAPSAGRWSLSAWAFVREGDSAPLAAVGLLGGSQAGARLAYRLNRNSGRPLALSLRLTTPLRRTGGAEAAVGVDWKPAGRLPVHILAERRQALGREGRSAFGVTLYGGVGDARLGPFRMDGYAQAGIVGARSRDPFADGSLRLSLPLGARARLGAGAWAAAQPGLARLDVGPQAALRLPVAGRSVTVAADWRVRVAGNAEPGSGPTLTLATDF